MDNNFRICKFSAIFMEKVSDIEYHFNINEIESLNDIVALSISYLRYKSPSNLLTHIDNTNWHIHDVILEDIINNPLKIIWVCGHKI